MSPTVRFTSVCPILTENDLRDKTKYLRIPYFQEFSSINKLYIFSIPIGSMDIIADQPIETEINGSPLIIRPLGAGREVGRSCIYLSFKGKVVLFDCGILPSCTGRGSLPFLDTIEDEHVDLVLISHFHLDHCGALPVLPRRKFFHPSGSSQATTEILMTLPTRAIMKGLLTDFLAISSSDSKDDGIYDIKDLETCIGLMHTINYHEERWHNGIKITCYQAGHVLGAAMFCVEIDSIRILYTGDFSREEDRHLPAAVIPDFRPNIVISESTYGHTNHDNRRQREDELVSSVASTLSKRGKVLIPVFALGRTQELLLLLDEYWENHPQTKRIGQIVYLNTLAKKSMMLFKESINMMNDTIRNTISDHNPFDLRNVTMPENIDDWLSTDLSKIPPCVILCSPAMMENGTSRLVLERIANGENNRVILTGYCMVDTIARRLRENESEIPVLNGRSNETIKVNCQVNTISFSAHSDFKGTCSLLRDLQPDHVILVHGESSKMEELANGLRVDLSDRYNQGLIDFFTPENMKSLQFRYNLPKYVKIVGHAADREWNNHIHVSGLLVKENFKYQLIDAEDVDTFTRLKLCRVLYRQHFSTIISLKHMYEFCLLAGSEVEMSVDKQSIIIDKIVTIRFIMEKNSTSEYNMEWMGSYETDLKANALMMILLKEEKLIISTINERNQEIKTKNDESIIQSESSIELSILRDLLEEQYGHVVVDDDSCGWTITLPIGAEIHIVLGTWEIDCADELIRKDVKETIDTVISAL